MTKRSKTKLPKFVMSRVVKKKRRLLEKLVCDIFSIKMQPDQFQNYLSIVVTQLDLTTDYNIAFHEP